MKIFFICCVLFKGFKSLEFKVVSQSSVFDKTQVAKDVWAEKAIDGNPFTYTTTGDGNNNYWKVVFLTKRNISCFTIIATKGASLRKSVLLFI